MKRLFAILLAMLLLVGCGKKEAPQPETKPSTKPEQPSNSWYEEGSSQEGQTGGALLLHRVESETVNDLAFVDGKILLVSQSAPTKLTVLTAKDCMPLKSLELELGATGVQTLYHTVAYYLPATNEAVYLDLDLQELSRIKLPKEIQGTPVFAPDGSEIYYCTDQEIKALDTTENISRPVRNHSCKSQAINGIYFDGEVISCHLEYEDGTEETVFISGKTGALLRKDNGFLELTTSGGQYLALRMDGSVRQQIVGTLDGESMNLLIDRNEKVASAVALGGVISYYTDESGTTNLSFYDMASGLRTATLSVSGIGEPQRILTDTTNSCVWILSTDSADGTQILCSWNYKKSAVSEEEVHLQPVFSKDNPDTEGLSDVQDRADALSSKHSVDIRISKDALSRPGTYTLEEEYQTQAIMDALDELETVLEKYPELFFYKSVNRLLRVCIVRSINGETTGVQYWDGAECCIVLAVGCDMEAVFNKGMGYVITNKILANSPHLDGWTGLNPEGFAYGETKDEKYLEGENRAFADLPSMESVTDDRSILFSYAMGDDNDELFQSPIMQEKLTLLCMGIRDAWRWEKKTEVYPWEQYLKVPLAPEK